MPCGERFMTCRVSGIDTPISFVSFRERNDRVVEWFDHNENEAGFFFVMAWDAHRSVAV
jgi:hypothetical protein